jgi:hypothetical protein
VRAYREKKGSEKEEEMDISMIDVVLMLPRCSNRTGIANKVCHLSLIVLAVAGMVIVEEMGQTACLPTVRTLV